MSDSLKKHKVCQHPENYNPLFFNRFFQNQGHTWGQRLSKGMVRDRSELRFTLMSETNEADGYAVDYRIKAAVLLPVLPSPSDKDRG
jgi:hypothetical protein